tara:strand:+ start:339 stop:1139 length:801 start_codon:yes stop_codon:yes gene_type:complete
MHFNYYSLSIFLNKSRLLIKLKILIWKYFFNTKIKYKKLNLDDSLSKEININLKKNGIIFYNSNQILEKKNNSVVQNIKNYIDNNSNNIQLENIYEFKFNYILDSFLKKQLNKIANDKNIKGIVDNYLEVKNFLYNSSIWCDKKVISSKKDTQLWHKDGDDLKLIKIFIYLNDIDENKGPFCYIKSTHSEGRLSNVNFDSETNFRANEEHFEEEVFKKKYIEVTGKQGTLIIADTKGYHRGKSLLEDRRQMIILTYLSERKVVKPS